MWKQLEGWEGYKDRLINELKLWKFLILIDVNCLCIEKTSLLVAEGHTEYNYQEMLDRIQKLLKDKNPQLAESKKLSKNEDPYVVKLGTTKTVW